MNMWDAAHAASCPSSISSSSFLPRALARGAYQLPLARGLEVPALCERKNAHFLRTNSFAYRTCAFHGGRGGSGTSTLKPHSVQIQPSSIRFLISSLRTLLGNGALATPVFTVVCALFLSSWGVYPPQQIKKYLDLDAEGRGASDIAEKGGKESIRGEFL
jgi:hypothetical protein